MDFGRILQPELLESVDFSLPKGSVWLGKQSDDFRVYLGCPVWSMKEWIGKVYPAKTRSSEYLYHYSRQFNTVELNSTYYNIPKPGLLDRWVDAVPETFRFCPKVPKLMANSPDLFGPEKMFDGFLEVLMKLGDNLGPVFLQLPQNHSINKIKSLSYFLDEFPENVPLAVELRHPGWFLSEEPFDLLRAHNVCALITDTAGRRDVCHMNLTTDFAFVRFAGNNLHPTDFDRIDQWVLRLKEWKSQGLKSCYFFIHQPQEHLGPELINDFISKLNSELGLSLSGYTSHSGGVQGSLF